VFNYGSLISVMYRVVDPLPRILILVSCCSSAVITI